MPRFLKKKRRPSVTRIGLDRELRRQFARLAPGVVLDVGSKASPYREVIPHTRYLRMDVNPRSAPDLLCDIRDIEAQDASFDTLIATEVLEHVAEPQRAIDEIARVLRPGGVCILSTRFIYQVHPDPQDFYRFTADSLRHLFRAFTAVEVHHHGNRFQAVWQLLCHGSLKRVLGPLNPLVARVHVEETKAPLGYVVFAVR